MKQRYNTFFKETCNKFNLITNNNFFDMFINLVPTKSHAWN